MVSMLTASQVTGVDASGEGFDSGGLVSAGAYLILGNNSPQQHWAGQLEQQEDEVSSK